VQACARLLALVHERERYPVRMPKDARAFLTPADLVAAWVATSERAVTGHAALHERSNDAVMRLARDETGQPDSGLAVVARLFVHPEARSSGTGSALLSSAAQHAFMIGRTPVLDVAIHLTGAIRFYEQAGWARLGAVTATLGDGLTFEEYVYVAPSPNIG
jgi:GNAT superfamily N-acetyltransferase